MKRTLALALAIALAVAPGTGSANPTRITIDARATDLGDLIRLIGMQAGRNLVADGSIKPQRVSFRLTDVDPETAVTLLVNAFGLQLHREGEIVLIGEAAAMSRRYADAVQTETFTLVHAAADELATALNAALPPGTVVVPDRRTASVVVAAPAMTIDRARALVVALDVPARGSATPSAAERIVLRNLRPSEAVKLLHGTIPDTALVADDRANAVVVTATAAVTALATELLAALDRPGREVMLEVRVADVRPIDDSSSVGLEFGGTGFGTGALGQVPFTAVKSSLTIDAQLHALVQHGRAEILATPRLTTLNNREAALLIGEQYPVVTVNQQTGFPSVQTIDVGVRLRITPTIGDDGTLTVDLHPEFSQVLGFNASFPIVANRKLDTTIRVRDGETIVLGGLFQEVSSETATRIPFLADIPVLGKVFRNRARSHTRDEVVFFITPHLVAP